MAYRFRLISEVKYGHFGEFLKTWKKLDSIMRDRGWAGSRVLVPTVGPNNQVIAEFEYPDLATYEGKQGVLRRQRGVRGVPSRC